MIDLKQEIDIVLNKIKTLQERAKESPPCILASIYGEINELMVVLSYLNKIAERKGVSV